MTLERTTPFSVVFLVFLVGFVCGLATALLYVMLRMG
jgi:hypothetical protein